MSALRRAGGASGLSAITVLFILTGAMALWLATAAIVGNGQISLVSAKASIACYQSAQSGLEWVKQATDGYTTANRNDYLALDNTSINYAGPGGPGFTISVSYSDPDSDPATDDTVSFLSTGSCGMESVERTLSLTSAVPATFAMPSELFSDEFDQADSSFFDSHYLFGSADSGGVMTPFKTAMDTSAFTLGNERWGRKGLLGMSGTSELMIGAPGTGVNLPLDSEGFQNYFIKTRVMLEWYPGFGVYFRASYAGQSDPAAVSMSSANEYVWQYDAEMGYLPPCDSSTSVPNSAPYGMLFARKIMDGKEYCADCGLFRTPFTEPSGQALYPFFCPENRRDLPELAGWGWGNGAWRNNWRTIYIYVYKAKAEVYMDRETGSGPEQVAHLQLGSVGSTFLKTGAVGLKVWGGAMIKVDYIKIFSNDDNKNPSVFTGIL